ncbi:Ferroxidase [uncultured spirochete]|jgi:ferritin|uniref:Ferritin n=1 Tax=uncultured spirochete TaxID=156406 RepID=A0A3P3XPG3_9SPIR|nr:Ferroxidase [uncultured spirochete]
MVSQKMVDRINLQINREMYSAYLYLAMAAKMNELGYTGIGKWLTVQYHEEMFHAMKFAEYLHDQNAVVAFAKIDTPEFKEKDVKPLFEHVLAHEQGVSASIREIMDLAIAEKDYATQTFVQWYINEQVEEEKNATEILQNIDLVGNSAQGLFMLNTELGKRDPSVPLDFNKI